MDIISEISDSYSHWAASLSQKSFGFAIGAALLYLIPCALCAYARAKGSKSIFIQCLCLTFGVLLAISIPYHAIHISNPTARSWLISFCIVLVLFLPGILPRFVAPTVGSQHRLTVVGYGILVILFFLNVSTRE